MACLLPLTPLIMAKIVGIREWLDSMSAIDETFFLFNILRGTKIYHSITVSEQARDFVLVGCKTLTSRLYSTPFSPLDGLSPRGTNKQYRAKVMQEYIDFVSNNMILTLVWVGLAATLLMSLIKQKTAAYKVVAPNDAAILNNRENGVFVDIRSHDEFRAGHITGAINVLPSEIKSHSFGELEKHKTDPIIVVCKTGQTAADSANQLAKAGFESVYVLKDGLTSWNDAKMPLVRAKSGKGKSKKKK